jgi:hypothetical protein
MNFGVALLLTLHLHSPMPKQIGLVTVLCHCIVSDSEGAAKDGSQG